MFLDWRDTYNWDPWKSVVIPGYGRIYDRSNEMLQVCKGAKPFLQISSWKLNFDANVKVDSEQPPGLECKTINGVVTIKPGSGEPENPNGGYEPQNVGRGCVTWKNQDNVPHTATSGRGPDDPNSGKLFDTSIIMPGETWTGPITSGSPYHCSVHPWLKGTVS